MLPPKERRHENDVVSGSVQLPVGLVGKDATGEFDTTLQRDFTRVEPVHDSHLSISNVLATALHAVAPRQQVRETKLFAWSLVRSGHIGNRLVQGHG